MKPIENIISDHRHIYSNRIEIANDGFKGFMTVDRVDMSFVASWGGGWDHVSVAPLKKKIVPSWEMMCKVKDIFFEPDEAVIQIHPPKTDYVNNMPNCLHLWRANDKEMMLPPSFMVGIRKGQTMADVLKEADEYYAKGGYT